MILKRFWLKKVSVIKYYEIDEYWIKKHDANYQKFIISRRDLIKTTKIYLKKCYFTMSTQRSNLLIDEKILIDMNYNENERVNAILQQIIKKTEIEKTINEDEKQ